MTQLLTELLQPLLDQRTSRPLQDFSMDEVRQWVDDLGEDKPFESLEALSHLLEAFNQTLLTQSSRFELLELLRPVVDQSLLEVSASYHRSPWPPSSSIKRLMKQVDEIVKTFFYGYALSIVEEPAPSNLGRAIHRALDFAQRKMVEDLRRYRTGTPLDGALIYALYQYARELDCHANSIEPWDAPGIDWDSSRLTNEKQFLRILILQLLQPSGWWAGEAAELSRWVGQWVSDLEGLSETPSQRKTYLYAIDMETPSIPSRIESSTKRRESAEGELYFSLDTLVNRLQRHAPDETLSEEESPTAYIPRLSQRLLEALKSPTGTPDEGEELWPDEAPPSLTLVQGFEAAHQWLSKGQSASAESAETALPALHHSGVTVRMAAEQARGVQVGELMVWHDDPSASPAAWRLAEVVQLHLSERGSMEVGLQLIPDSVEAGEIKSVVANQSEMAGHPPCLLLLPPALPERRKTLGKELILLTPPLPFALGTMYEAVFKDQIHLIELTQKERQTASYTRWRAARIQSIRRDGIG